MPVFPPDAPAPPPLFPLFLSLDRAPVLIVGGGAAAVGKLRLLLPSGAAVSVVDPDPCEEIIALAGRVTLHRRAFVPGDLAGVRLCYVALESALAADDVVAEARRQGVLVNSVDRPAGCDFITPAVVERGEVTIAISTGGASPALARDLRGRIEAAIPPAYGAIAAFCRRWRARVAGAIRDHDRRRVFWDSVLDGPEAAAVLAGRAGQADDLLSARLLGHNSPEGRATLVGVGPGDPDLLTLKALRVLQRADLLLYDKLVDPRVIDLARRDARRIDVGKRCGRHEMSQAAINRLIVAEVRHGAHVVRLKGGDPFIFGRGGEEVESLRAAGIPVEIVPGITAASAAAARFAVPLTHRGVARSLHVVTGHGSDGAIPAHDWAALARAGGTLAIYMGAGHLAGICEALLKAGLRPDLPALAVESVTLPGERRMSGTLATIAAITAAEAGAGPVIVLIGETVALAASAESGPVEPETLEVFAQAVGIV